MRMKRLQAVLLAGMMLFGNGALAGHANSAMAAEAASDPATAGTSAELTAETTAGFGLAGLHADETGKGNLASGDYVSGSFTMTSDAVSEKDALTGYMESFLKSGKNNPVGRGRNSAAYGKMNVSRRDKASLLTYSEKVAYDQLLGQISKIAAGTRTDTRITITVNSGADYDWGTIYRSLRSDHPELFFWGGRSCSLESSGSSMTLSFKVADDFTAYPNGTGDARDYFTDVWKVQTVNQAAANACNIINAARGLSDYDRLKYYMEQIDSLNVYNAEAAGMDNPGIENPWQMIWIFDGNPSTNVVCEGYAKAFKYLCDNTGDFTDRQLCAYTVTGKVFGNLWYLGGGPHMWNIVHTSRGNYLVDTTWCDADVYGGSAPSTYELFMAGGKKNLIGDWVISWEDGVYSDGAGGTLSAGHVTYRYDSDTKSIYDTSELALSPTFYSGGDGGSGDGGSGDGEEDCSHVWQAWYTTDQKATCGEAGSKSVHCLFCSAIKPGSRKVIPATGQHKFGPWTRDAAGREVQVCTVCGYKKTKGGQGQSAGLSFAERKVPLRMRQKSPKIALQGMSAGDRIIKVSSSDPSLVTASFTSDGIRLRGGSRTGNARVTATLQSGDKASLTVRVQKNKVHTKGIRVACGRSLVLRPGQRVRIGAAKVPVTSSDRMTCKNSRKNVASVKGGTIIAKRRGRTVITIRSGKKSTKIRVTVR